MKIYVALAIAWIVTARVAIAGDVGLSWDFSTQPEVTGYWIYYGSASGKYTDVVDTGNSTYYTIPNLAPGTWYFAVKAYGSVGQQSAFSNEVVVTVPQSTGFFTADSITVTGITSKSATLSWTTNQLGDSEAEYWAVGSESTKAVLRTLVTKHSLTLNQLLPLTRYYVRAKSTSADGSQTAAAETSFTTPWNGASAYVWPRFSSAGRTLGTDTTHEITLLNPNRNSTGLALTAMEPDGTLSAGQDISNPIYRVLAPQSRVSYYDWQLFGNGIANLTTNGWFKLEADSDQAGSFQISDAGLQIADNSILEDRPLRDLIFPTIQNYGYNRISLINNNPQDASVAIDIVRADGTVRSSRSQVIAKYAALTADIFRDLFRTIYANPDEYIRVRSGKLLNAFMFARQNSGDISMAAGQDITAGATTLYCPQYLGGVNRTELSIINLDSTSGTVTLRLFGDSGAQIGKTRTSTIPPKGKLHIDDLAYFQTTDSNPTLSGYVVISSNGIRLAGSLVFGDKDRQSFYSELPLLSRLERSLVLGSIPSDSIFFTGIAIINPNGSDAVVHIDLYSADGNLAGSKIETIGPGKRTVRLATDYFPTISSGMHSSNYLRLTSDKPIAGIALFGAKTMSAISNIPFQVAQ
jgi:hypothetical protein